MTEGQDPKNTAENNKQLKEQDGLYKGILQTLEDERDVIGDIVSYTNQLLKLKNNVLNADDKTSDLNRAQRDHAAATVKNNQKILDLKAKQGTLTASEFKDQMKTLQEDKASLNVAGKKLKHAISLNKVLQDTGDVLSPIANSTGDLIDGITGFVDALPGGKTVSRLFGLDTLKAQSEDLLNTFGSEMVTALQANKSPVEAVQAGLAKIGPILKGGFFSPITLIAAAIAGIAIIFSNISKKAKELSKETGVTFAQAKNLNDQARQVQSQYSTQLATVEDITAVQKEQIALLGSAALVNTEIAGQVADQGRAFGYGAEQAGKTHAALKSGVNIAAVQKDIADNASLAAKYFAGSGKLLADAAVQAAKMGVSLGQMVKIADGLLNIEESLTAQFEFQALSGKQINLDRARALALEGDIAGATKEVMRNVGSAADFAKMNRFEREALAKATGMEVGELQKSLAIQEKLGDLNDDQKAAMANMNLSAAEMNNMSAEELQNRLAQQQSMDKAGAAFQSIKNELITALLPLAEAFGSVFTLLGPVLKTIGKVLGIAFMPLKWAGEAMQFLFDLMERFKGTSIALGTIMAGNYLYQKLGTREQQKALLLKVQDKVQTGLINAAKFIGLGYDKLAGGEQKKKLSLIGLEYLKTAALNTIRLAGVGLQLAWNTAKGIGNALLVWAFGNETATNALIGARLILEQAVNAAKAVGNALAIVGNALGLAAIGRAVAGAVGFIFSAFAQIPFGLGIPLAIAAVAGLFGLVSKAKKAGDVQAPAKGKTMISTREGGLFETSKNDDVAAGPGILSKLAGAASNPIGAIGSLFGGGGEESGGGANNEALMAKLDELINAVKTPPPVYIGDKAVTELSSALQINDSFQTTQNVSGTSVKKGGAS